MPQIQIEAKTANRILTNLQTVHYSRPTIHITAPCWINDPCAPGYDPGTGLYHVFFQCKCLYAMLCRNELFVANTITLLP